MIRMTGTPPNSMRYKMITDPGYTKLRIPYPNAGSYAIYVDGNEIEYTPWDATIGRHAALTGTKGCGENRFVGIENYLEFIITNDCEVKVAPKDSIMSSVRLDWTLEGFYADGGVVSFTDRVAGALGIHASNIKTVAVYKGSVIVDFFIEYNEGDDEDDDSGSWLAEKGAMLWEAIATDVIDLGAPILDAITDGTVVVKSEDGFFEDESASTRPQNDVSGGKFD